MPRGEQAAGRDSRLVATWVKFNPRADNRTKLFLTVRANRADDPAALGCSSELLSFIRARIHEFACVG